MESEFVRTFAFHGGLVLFKTILMSPLTGFHRIKNSVSIGFDCFKVFFQILQTKVGKYILFCFLTDLCECWGFTFGKQISCRIQWRSSWKNSKSPTEWHWKCCAFHSNWWALFDNKSQLGNFQDFISRFCRSKICSYFFLPGCGASTLPFFGLFGWSWS